MDSVDILYEAGGVEAKKIMIATLDELCRISENLTLLLTCKEQLLRDRDEYIGRTKELVGRLCTFIYAYTLFRCLSIKEGGKSSRLGLHVS